MPTKYSIAEQVLLRLEAGFVDVANSVQIQDLILAVGQKVNVMFKMQQFTQTFAMGETIPDGLVLATYSTPVVSFGGKKSKAVLPVMPVSLTRNMGVYEVADDEWFTCPYIPVQAGQASLLKGQALISDLLGQVGYEIYGNAIITSKDVTIMGITTLWIHLVVSDVSSLSDYDPLPIPADYEAVIIEEIYKSFVPVQQAEATSHGIVKQPKEVQK